MILCPIHELREDNDCHLPAGTPEGGRFCSKGFLRGETARARTLGVRFDVSPTTAVRDSGFYARDRRIELGLGTDEWKLNRAGILSVARHELGHVTDPDYGERKAQRIIDGKRFGPQYAEEFGAWRAAVRDAPANRVQWRTVRQSLTNYLYDDFLYTSHVKDALMRRGVASGPTQEDWDTFSAAVDRELERTLDRHVAILKRYARRARRR